MTTTLTYLLSSEIIHMTTVSFDDLWRLRSFRTPALIDGDRGLSPKSGRSTPSGSDSIPLMGMGPGSSGMMPLSSIPWWICLALRRTLSMASEVKLPGSESVCVWMEQSGWGRSGTFRKENRKGEERESRRKRGGGRKKKENRVKWSEKNYKNHPLFLSSRSSLSRVHFTLHSLSW